MTFVNPNFGLLTGDCDQVWTYRRTPPTIPQMSFSSNVVGHGTVFTEKRSRRIVKVRGGCSPIFHPRNPVQNRWRVERSSQADFQRKISRSNSYLFVSVFMKRRCTCIPMIRSHLRRSFLCPVTRCLPQYRLQCAHPKYRSNRTYRILFALRLR